MLLEEQVDEEQTSRRVLQYLTIIFLSIFFAKIFLALFPNDSWGYFHGIFEAACILIALSIFFATWHIYDKTSVSINILGFGFLIAAILNTFHIIYSDIGVQRYGDISGRFWIISRFVEALTFLLGTSQYNYNFKINKFLGLIFSVGFSLLTSYYLLEFPQYFPQLRTAEGVTPIKITLELVVIGLFMLSLYNIKKDINIKTEITYRYIFFALLVAVPAEFCHIMLESLNSFAFSLGHILKLISYYFLYQGVFVSIIKYPYNKLEECDHLQQICAQQTACAYFEADSKEIQNLQLQTQTILNAIHSPIVIVDTQNKIVMCNNTFLEFFNVELNKLKAADMKDFKHLIQNGTAVIRNVKTINDQKTFEITYITNKGKKELMINTSPILNIEGKIIGKIGVASDITSVKTEQYKLQQQEKLALLGQMAAGIVHEIRNPLTTIRGFSQIIKTKAQDQMIREYAEIIETATSDANKVVSDFLAFAKPHPPLFTQVSANNLVQSMNLMLDSHSFLEGVEISLKLSEKEKFVKADEGQIKQVILNIVKNAIEAMQEVDKPKLSIETFYNEGLNEMFITIKDNGKGMLLEDKIKVGSPFFTTKDRGTGLGLSICYQIINEHGGRIEFESQLGVGTSFTIVLPCLE